MAIDQSHTRHYLQQFAFEDLFIEELGWDIHNEPHEVLVDGEYLSLQAIAQKRGMVAFTYEGIPDNTLRRKIERQVARSIHEHFIIYVGDNEQIWQWVRREPGKPLANRELRCIPNMKEEGIIQALDSIAFSFDEEDDLTIVDVTSRVRAAFDVERVTRRFYDFFKSEHDEFLKFLEGIPDSEMERWYASVMLNRLMFIYFVQKKGFLDDDLDYLHNKLDGTEGNFYREFLIPLFFQGFALREEDRLPDIRQLLGKVPYLNGGLFLPHQIEEAHGKVIHIENEAFERLFDFFDRYQWHLDERPLRRDTEINPDVLGYIFEKYINQKQMGAYYTKEDITEYISQNTIIPFLLDEARKNCKVAFEGKGSVWELLQADPDRYIHAAVRHGANWELPEEIAVGLNDVSQRDQWNTPAPAEYGLPTEIWREVVARRQRYEEVYDKLESGEVTSVNDLITLNLNIRQFAQDVVENAEGSDLLKAVWNAINTVTVLDPTCGSGAFLFAALNILEPLYEACLDRMQIFIDELEREEESPHPQKYKPFREALEQVAHHPNRKYFIYKSIIVNNLYGVDIMEEAVEICKLRLFLKLVAQVERVENIEPLPDIDFNIRAGNTLVGFTSMEQVKQAITNPTGDAPKLLVLDEDAKALQEIEEDAQDIDRLFGLFREQQTQLGGEISADDKQDLRDRLRKLDNRLSTLLSSQYGIDSKKREYEVWLQSHKPFHWFTNFYGIIADGGFDVVFGNPPYVEYRDVRGEYRILNYFTESCGNLYAYSIERCVHLMRSKASRLGMIIPVASVCTGRYQTLQDLLKTKGNLFISNFNDRPGKLFEGLEHIRLAIVLWEATQSNQNDAFTTRYNKWNTEVRPSLFDRLEFTWTTDFIQDGSIPKLHTHKEHKILDKVFAQKKRLGYGLINTGRHKIYYTRKLSGFVQILDFVPAIYTKDGTKRDPSELKDLAFNTPEERDVALALLNSSLFYWLLTLYSDCRNLNKREIISVPVEMETIDKERVNALSGLARDLMNDLAENSNFLDMNYRKWGLLSIQCFYPKYSKHIIDEIDGVLAKHYGFTDEELDFIINYDIKFRMGDDLFEDEEDEAEE